MNFENIINLIDDCKYITNSKSNKKTHITSLSFLIDKKLSQSECIRLGIVIEKYLSQLICTYTELSKLLLNIITDKMFSNS